MRVSESQIRGIKHLAADVNLMDNVELHKEQYTQLTMTCFPGAWIKRAADIFCSLMVSLILLSWLIPLLALLIKLSSRGPVFFIQQRTGRYNVPFNCYKLRSMIVNEQADSQQAVYGDSRITWVGRFLRKTSLDELPQFFNVIRGDMSLVGPRPHMLYHTAVYAKDVKEYPKRLLVRPGITGLSQVEGYRGEIRNHRMIRNRVILDIFYIKHWSPMLDVLIIFKTIKLLLIGDKRAF